MRQDRFILAFLLCVLPGAFWPGSTTYEAAKFLVLAVSVAALLLSSAWQVGRGQRVLAPSNTQFGLWLGLLLLILLSGTMGPILPVFCAPGS